MKDPFNPTKKKVRSKSLSNYHCFDLKLKLTTFSVQIEFNIHIISVPLVTGIRTKNNLSEQLKAIIETNDINDHIARQHQVFTAKDTNKELKMGYDMTIIIGKRIEGSADNALFLGRFHRLNKNNDDLGKLFLKEIIEINLKVGKNLQDYEERWINWNDNNSKT